MRYLQTYESRHIVSKEGRFVEVGDVVKIDKMKESGEIYLVEVLQRKNYPDKIYVRVIWHIGNHIRNSNKYIYDNNWCFWQSWPGFKMRKNNYPDEQEKELILDWKQKQDASKFGI
jgi:hypothetical protein